MAGKIVRGIFVLVFLGYLLSMGSVYFSYIEPYIFPLKLIQGEARHVTENVIAGPYPHEKDIERLYKVSGVKVIISLLNPSLPFEKSLLEKEKEITEKYGLEFYNIPISFINLNSPENVKNVSKVLDIIKKHKGDKIYVHCYLGRHRVELVVNRLIGADY